jgi:hypothetical protein
MQAYSPTTDTHYDDWDDLVKANGYIATAIFRRGKKIWSWSVGPYSQDDANKARNRIRYKVKREGRPELELVVINVRPLWKDI